MRNAAVTAIVDPPEKPTSKPETAAPDVPASVTDIDPGDVESYGDEQARVARAVESVFTKLADGSELTDSELAILRRAGPQIVPRDGGRSARAFERWKTTETARILKVRKLQSQAGTGSDRQAASDAATKAETAFASRSAEIDAAISQLQAERSKLQQTADVARAESDRRQVALRRLREKSVLPAYVYDRLRQAENRWSSGDGHSLETKRNRLKVLTGLAALDVSERRMVPGGYSGGKGLQTVQGYVEGCPAFGSTPDERLRSMGMLQQVERPPHGTITEVVPDGLDRAKWSAYLSGPVASEIETLRAEIARLEIKEVEHNSASAKLSNFYVPD